MKKRNVKAKEKRLISEKEKIVRAGKSEKA
jgi:hypothetical protein